MKQEYRIDPTRSSAQFTARHTMIRNVREAFSGIQDAQRDAHLKSAEFLDVSKLPTISFHSATVEAVDGGELSITGDLRMHGARPVVLQVDPPSTESKDRWGNLTMSASATTRIRRSGFGLVWSKALERGGILVGDKLKLPRDVSLILA